MVLLFYKISGQRSKVRSVKGPINYLFYLFVFSYFITVSSSTFTRKEIKKYRDQVKSMFYHAYDGYMKYAFPYDELRPLTCDGHDTWGSYSLTLIDALDTLAVVGNKTEFQRVANVVAEHSNFDTDINVSVFETNIRIIGGLLSAHLMSRRMGVDVGKDWPCDGPLLKLAEDVINRILPAFDTPTGMPFGTVNLRNGVPPGETPITCTAGVGTFIIEFGTLSRLTNNPLYENVALRAMHYVWQNRSPINLIGNHIDVMTGRWTAQDAGIGAGVDSYYEYLVKGSLLLKRPELMSIFHESRAAIEKHLRHDDWYLWGTMNKGHITMAVFQSLEAFWPGVLSLIGDLSSAQKTIYNYHHVWKQYGFTPEFFNIPQGEPAPNREGYPLRPELAESLMYMFQATGDHTFLQMGADIVTTIIHSTKTSCGFATVKNVNDHSLDNQMESFFLAETTKYLYLLFDTTHWLHNKGSHGRYHEVKSRSCVMEAGGYIYNTEAHPVDPGAFGCCSGPEKSELYFNEKDLIDLILDPTISFSQYRGNPSASHVNQNIQYEEDIEKREDSNVLESLTASEKIVQVTLNDEDALKIRESQEIINNKGTVRLYHLGPENGIDLVEKNSNIPNEDKGINPNDKIPKLLLPEKDAIGQQSPVYQNDIDDELVSSNINQNSEQHAEENKVSLTKSSTNHVESKLSEKIEVERQNINKSSSVMEQSGITTSVSSSKYSLNLVQLAASRLLIQKEIELSTSKPRRNKIFSLNNLKERLDIDLNIYSNFTKSKSYSILSCPHPGFTNMLNFKGQMFNP